MNECIFYGKPIKPSIEGSMLKVSYIDHDVIYYPLNKVISIQKNSVCSEGNRYDIKVEILGGDFRLIATGLSKMSADYVVQEIGRGLLAC